MNYLKYFLATSILAVGLFSFGLPSVVRAADDTSFQTSPAGPYVGLEVGAYTGLGTRDVRLSASLIIRVAMGFLGIAATVIILIGGYTWMTAGGNDEKIGEAKKWIFAGVIGLVIIFSAYSISSFVMEKIVNSTVNTNFVGD